MASHSDLKNLLEEKDKTIYDLNNKLFCMRQALDNERLYTTRAEKKVEELKEKNKQLLKENVELLLQMRKLLKEAEIDGRTQDVCEDDN